jgi:catenin alpha
MSMAAREFADDPCSSLKRGNMVRAARNLLSAVTRLLILADMVDVHLLLKSLRVVGIKLCTKCFTLYYIYHLHICYN